MCPFGCCKLDAYQWSGIFRDPIDYPLCISGSYFGIDGEPYKPAIWQFGSLVWAPADPGEREQKSEQIVNGVCHRQISLADHKFFRAASHGEFVPMLYKLWKPTDIAITAFWMSAAIEHGIGNYRKRFRQKFERFVKAKAESVPLQWRAAFLHATKSVPVRTKIPYLIGYSG